MKKQIPYTLKPFNQRRLLKLIQLKGTGTVISSDPPYKGGNSRFTRIGPENLCMFMEYRDMCDSVHCVQFNQGGR